MIPTPEELEQATKQHTKQGARQFVEMLLDLQSMIDHQLLYHHGELTVIDIVNMSADLLACERLANSAWLNGEQEQCKHEIDEGYRPPLDPASRYETLGEIKERR